MEKLPELKRELEQRSPPELVKICLRFARLKQENKEFLAYLLNDADDPLYYAEKMKDQLVLPFSMPFTSKYLFAKSLRKSVRLIAKFARFTADKQGETELLLHLVSEFHAHYKFDLRSAAIGRIVFRCLRKADSLIAKMHDELKADYTPRLEELFELSLKRLGREYFDQLPLKSIPPFI